MLSWLSNLDPNVVITALSFLAIGGKWLYHKVRGDQQKSLKDTLWPTIEGVVIKLAESPFVADTVRTKLTAAANEALGRIGVNRNSVTDALIAQLVDAGVTEVRKRVNARIAVEQLPARIEAMATAAQKMVDAFKPPANPTVPALGLDIEIVKPE